jgi:DNA topoisomerase-1
LEERGIGRPSTYAPTISTLFDRKYIERDEGKKLYPLEIGILVTNLLSEHFKVITDTDFTATMEESLDHVAEGEKEWVPVVRNYYEPFHKNLTKKKKEVKKEDLQEKVGRLCPEDGKELIYKFGRFGKFIACENYPTCKYTEKTEEEKKMDEEFKDIDCEICGAPMKVKRGRFGAFLGCSNYPECKGIQKIEKKAGVHCPLCGVGELVEKKTGRGRNFYGCNKYPSCTFATWTVPTPDNVDELLEKYKAREAKKQQEQPAAKQAKKTSRKRTTKKTTRKKAKKSTLRKQKA